MRCPKCQAPDTQVVDSRDADDDTVVRRRRECVKCSHRFTSYERVEPINLRVVKKDGRREQFDPIKLRRGVYLSFEKLDTPKEKIDAMLEQIEQAIYGRFAGEVSSKEIGETALKFIKKVDQVAYIRFASVYRQFVDLEDFEKEIQVAFKKSRG